MLNLPSFSSLRIIILLCFLWKRNCFSPFVPNHLLSLSENVLFQRDLLLCYLFRGFFSHITVMPWLIYDFGHIRLVRRIAEDKSIFPAVFHEPFLLCRIPLFIIQFFIL